MLRGEIILNGQSEPNVITRVPVRGREEAQGQGQRRSDMVAEVRVIWGREPRSAGGPWNLEERR